MLSLQLLSLLFSALGLTSAAPSTVAKRDNTWGGAVSLGPTTSHIISSSCIIIPGTAPATQAGDLTLWPGISNGTGDLIQTVVWSWEDQKRLCGATSGQWCVQTSVYGLFNGVAQQLSGNASPVDGSDHILIKYTLEENGQNWTQVATNAVTGAALSHFSHVSGPMTGWGTATECNDNCNVTVSEQRYQNVTITLASADRAFGDTLYVLGGATYTNLKVSEDGTVWTIDEIVVPAQS